MRVLWGNRHKLHATELCRTTTRTSICIWEAEEIKPHTHSLDAHTPKTQQTWECDIAICWVAPLDVACRYMVKFYWLRLNNLSGHRELTFRKIKRLNLSIIPIVLGVIEMVKNKIECAKKLQLVGTLELYF